MSEDDDYTPPREMLRDPDAPPDWQPAVRREWTPHQHARDLGQRLRDVKIALKSCDSVPPKRMAMAYIADSMAVLEAMEYDADGRIPGQKRIVDNLFHAIDLLEKSGGDFAEHAGSLMFIIAEASQHGLTIDGYDLSNGTHRNRLKNGPSP